MSDIAMPELPRPTYALYRDESNRVVITSIPTGLPDEKALFESGDMHSYARQYAAPIEAERDAMRAALKNIEIKAHLAATMCDNDARAKGFVILESLARAALTPTTKEPKP